MRAVMGEGDPETESGEDCREGDVVDLHHIGELVDDVLCCLEDGAGAGSRGRSPSAQVSLEDVAVAGHGGGVSWIYRFESFSSVCGYLFVVCDICVYMGSEG